MTRLMGRQLRCATSRRLTLVFIAYSELAGEGWLSACIEGMLTTSAPTIAVIDADLQHDETVLPKMLGEIEQGVGLT